MNFKNPFKSIKSKSAKVGEKQVELIEVYQSGKNKFYAPKDITDYPFIRIDLIHTYSRYADLKLTKERLHLLLSVLKKAVSEGSLEDVTILVNEIEIAESLFCEKNTLLDLSAAMFLINDEPVNSWNERYHNQKKEIMLNDADCMAFFLPTAYQMLKSSKENSALQVLDYLQKSLPLIERFNYIVGTFSQE